MDLERWKQVESVAQAALDQPAAEREPFLRSACGGDDALEREVRSLLSVEHRAGKFLESPALEAEAKALARENEQEAEERDGSWIGRTISHYSILEKVGEGGMGVVWKARDTRLDRLVALKFFPAGRVMDGGQRRRFLQEAQAASALNHPNIVTVYDIDEIGADGSFIAMEFVPGESLDVLIARKQIRLNEALDCMIQVAEALEAAHQAGIVHRDLKPGNIMLRQGGRVKVVDFGLAKLLEQGPHGEPHKISAIAVSRSLEGVIAGTASYMSPEQAEGRKLDARTDIFSFGAVLYEVITGRRAFDGDSAASTISAVLRDQPIPVAQIVNGIPRDLERIVTRCLEKNVGRRYQHAGDLKIVLQQVKEDLSAGIAALPITPKLRHWWWAAAAGAACLMASLALGWWLHNAPSPLTAVSVSQLTNDAGLSDYPALSPDGKLVAYSSDRSLNGERDLYIKQVAGGAAIRLTFDGADNTEPDFSPGGAKIVFRSNRDGGGIYEIPAFGGEPRLLTRNGRNPKFSPDGLQVAYWRGEDRVASTVPGSGSVWIVPTGGGSPVRVGEHLTAARNPIWSPDGKHLLLIGYASPTAGDASSLDWWFVPANGGNEVRSGFYQAMVRAGLNAHELAFSTKLDLGIPNVPRPGWWSPVSNTILFSASLGDRANLWKLGISPRTGRVDGVFNRITVGSANEIHASAIFGDTVAFANTETRNDVWSLPFDLDRGMAKGPLQQVTNGPAWREHSSLSRSGRYVAFASDQSGRISIWLRELASGKESMVAGSPTAVQRFPVLSPEGDRIAFSAYQEKRSVYLAAPGATPEKLCEGCLRATDWAADGKSLLIFGGDPYRISVLDVRSHAQTTILKHPIYNLLYGRFSPENGWVSFTVRTDSNHGRIVIAPLEWLKPVPENRWITIGEVGAQDWATWSPDGKTLYFTSPKDGHYCLWAQRIDAASHRPAGDAFAVQHFHGPIMYQAGGGWSAAGGRIAVVLAEGAGNIWLMSRAAAR